MRDGEVFGGLVRIGSNPSGSRPNFFGDSTSPLTREASVVVGGRGVVVLLQWLWGMAVLGATGGASSSPTKSEGYSANTKPYKHTQTLTLRKARGIVRFWEGWCKRGMVVRQSLRLDGKKFDKSKRWTYRKQNATISRLVPCRQSTSL